MKQVTVRFERDDDGWWVAAAKEIAGCHTQGRSIAQARERFFEALGLFVEHPERVVLREDIQLPAGARRVVKASTAARERADALQRHARESTVDAVQTLTRDLAMSVRDVGELLGLSHQRVQQLLRTREVAEPRTTSTSRRRKSGAAR
jgi:predicted RNase H-like HicB family nuclease